MFSTNYNESEKLWHGDDVPSLYNPEISLAQALLNSMTNFGPKISQINDNSGIEMTFDEIKTKTIRAAQNLRALGYKRGEVFGLIARNSHHVAPIVFASFAIGCPVNSLDPSFGQAELIHMLNITKPALVFCDVGNYELLRDCLVELKNNAKTFTFGGSVSGSEPVESLFKETFKDIRFIPVKVDGPNDIAMIVCTSGTTGLPKGVCLSHATILDNYSRRSDVSNFDDVMLCFSPLYWVSGVGVLIGGTLIGATRLITTEVFAPDLEMRLIEQYKVTYVMNAPHQVALMMETEGFNKINFSSIRYLLVGGSKVSLHIKTEMSRRLPNGNLYVGYGMSENGGPVSYDYPIAGKTDTVGRLVDGICVKIVDEQGNRCSPNVDGEICIKPRYKFLGYYNNQQASEETIDKENFIAVGDIGHFDQDGNLCITGRKKELLKYCNMQISPTEIDAFLTESSEIKSACIVGIPDPIVTDLPAAVVVRNERSKISEKEVFDMVADHFADHYKLRGGVYFVDTIPTTSSGKILRRQAKEIAVALFNARKV